MGAPEESRDLQVWNRDRSFGAGGGGGDHGNLHVALHGFVEHGPEDDVGVGIGGVMDDAGRFAHFMKQEIVASGNVDENAARALNGAVIEKPAGDRFLSIRKFDPRETIITSPALGRGVAQVLGSSAAVLLKGHGIALTDSSLNGLVSRAYNLRLNAKIQQQAIALGGKIAYLDGQPPAPAPAQPAGSGFDRAWEYWKRIIPAPN